MTRAGHGAVTDVTQHTDSMAGVTPVTGVW
jgi:hypothetical protein